MTESGAGSPHILPMGQSAVLAEVGSLGEVLALHAGLAASAPPGVIDIVPAARTVLVRLDPALLTLAAARNWIGAAAGGGAQGPAAGEPAVLDIAYDGPDLDEIAALLGLTADGLARRHAAASWTVAFTGFAPGFGYLVSPDWPFDVPRLAAPRTRVPAGAVGLAAQFTGAYPRDTPGGWRLIGTTAAALFDPEASTPALLVPGGEVRFARVRGAASVGAGPAHEPTSGVRPAAARTGARAGAGEPAGKEATAPGIRIVEPGLLATIQDLGRPGQAARGIARSGALDRGALRTANRLVGNPEGAAGIEVTLGGFRAAAERDLWVAVAGAWGDVRRGDAAIDPYTAHRWPAGAELHLDWFAHGARAYIAVRGGIDAREVAGSRATDVLSGIGPAPLRAGDAVQVGTDVDGPIPPVELAPWGAPQDDVVVELSPGPREDWLTPASLRALFEVEWTVTNQADRVGVRLDGQGLEHSRTGELPSEAMVPGAIQIPPSGLPAVLLADSPVTGGYPVVAVVADDSLDLLGQVRPGARVRFRHTPAAPR